tara:strand:- start:225 stop:2000 length:1776 start_codon:yes stop_codon:yes gene_type:complete
MMFDWIPWFFFSQIIIFHLSGLYDRMWRYTSLFDLYAILGSVFFSCLLGILSISVFTSGTILSRSILLLYFVFNSLITVGIRLIVRVYYSHYYQSSPLKRHRNRKRLLLIGAGKTGEKIVREILTSSREKYEVVGFVDDDSSKQGALLNGIKIYCTINNLPSLKINFDELLITAPSATGDEMRRIVTVCKTTGKRFKTVPSIYELIDGEVNMSSVRDVNYSDLLGRQEIKLDMNSIDKILKGKRILITGAGGSIGSELVRQCLSFEPSEIICLDSNEERIHNLNQSFDMEPSLVIRKTVLASIKNKKELEKVYNDNQPHIVFHAAAYKHVPIQESHPWTAVDTNIGGTLNLVKLADYYNVEKFVLVSTDKAVNPTNIMGATKRAAEILIQSFNSSSKTTFMAVRFGNVLGSSGSAIPTFKKQIKQGGPITITHPEMNRYFMSIQEASQLIIQCAALGKDGEIFLLEMGKPIKILQIAKDLIRLSGYEKKEIPIVFTGLRPGEKLYEELQLFNEHKVKTSHKKIMILKQSNSPTPWPIFEQTIQHLLKTAQTLDKDKIQELLKHALPTYQPDNFSSTVETKDKILFRIEGQA